MLITNLSQIAGYEIACAYGMVSTTVSMTRRVMKTSIGGSRSARESGTDGFSAELEQARKTAFSRLKQEAADIGATAIIGVSEQLHQVGEAGYMLMLTGTAADLQKSAPAQPVGASQPQVVYVQAPEQIHELPEHEVIEAVVRNNIIYPQFARA